MDLNNDNILLKLLEWIWVPMTLAVLKIWQKVNGHETRQRLLEQANGHYEAQRTEDRARHTEDRAVLEHRFDKLEALIKNGHK